MYIQYHSSSSNKSVVYFMCNFLFVDDEFLRLMKSSVFHNWHTRRMFTKFRFGAGIAIAYSNTFCNNNTN
jgi:hypothetical protein